MRFRFYHVEICKAVHMIYFWTNFCAKFNWSQKSLFCNIFYFFVFFKISEKLAFFIFFSKIPISDLNELFSMRDLLSKFRFYFVIVMIRKFFRCTRQVKKSFSYQINIFPKNCNSEKRKFLSIEIAVVLVIILNVFYSQWFNHTFHFLH